MTRILEKRIGVQRAKDEPPPSDLRAFIEEAWPIVDPAPFVGGWHVDAICEHLEACSSGDITRLIINVPPGSSKTMLSLVMWPAWEWTLRPEGKWMCATYEQPLSYTKANLCMRLLESEWYQERWGTAWRQDPKEWSAGMMTNSAGGFRYATSKGSGATGRHADRQIVDDPHKPQDILGGKITASNVRVDCENTYTWWTQTMATRLIAAPGIRPVRVVIMQRLHEADLTGKLLAEFGDEYVHLMIPQSFEPAWKCVTVLKRDPETKEPTKTWEDPRTEDGELMCPDRMDAEFVANRKKELGSRGHAAQEQQRPTPSGGGIFKREWIKFYKILPHQGIRLPMIQSWDMAFKETATSSFVVGQVWAREGANYYLVDQVRDRMDFSATLKAVETMNGKHPKAVKKLVEDKANGPAVLSILRDKVDGMIPVTPEGGKEARANAVAPLWEAGNVWLPDPATHPWVHDFIEELVSFPGVTDDQVDAMSQALINMHRKSTDAYRRAMAKV